MRNALIAMVAATVLLGACEQSKVDSGVATGSGQQYGSGYGADGRGVNSRDLGGQGAGGAGAYSDGNGTLDGQTPDRVFFGSDQYTLSPEARAVLDQQASWLSRYNQAFVVLQGHADERGTREYNLALGDRRAAAVRDYLTSRGVAPNRIRTISYGKEKPAVSGSSEAAWSKNRRTVTVVQ